MKSGEFKLSLIGLAKNRDSSYQLNFKATAENYILIKKLAVKYDVPVIRNAHLAKALSSLPLSTKLPREFIQVLDIILNQINKPL